jgi:predicted RNA binding protein with dsRBD fold (UPF0201 family)
MLWALQFCIGVDKKMECNMANAPPINEAIIQQPRTPSALRAFVEKIHDEVRVIADERDKGILKKGIYRVFLDEIVPLSRFAVARYTDEFKIQPVLGNQAYDALVLDRDGAIISKIEITVPHDGQADAWDSKLVVDGCHGTVHVHRLGEEIRELSRFILDTARKKAGKDYSDCTLVIVIKKSAPFESVSAAHNAQIDCIAEELRKIPFRAKKVFLFIMPDRMIPIMTS